MKKKFEKKSDSGSTNVNPSADIKHLVRIFTFRLAEGDVFDDLKNNYSFSEIIFGEMDEYANNPNAVMPMGGVIDASKTTDIIATARDKMRSKGGADFGKILHFENAEFNSQGQVPMDFSYIKQQYRFTHPKKKNEKSETREVTYVAGELLPSTKPFPVNQDDDHIRQFHYLTRGQLETLLRDGKITLNDKECFLLDGLNRNSRKRQEAGIRVEDADVSKARNFLKQSMEVFEANAKREVLELLFKFILPVPKNNADGYENAGERKLLEIKKLKNENPGIIEDFFQNVIDEYSVTSEQIQEAFTLLKLRRKSQPILSSQDNKESDPKTEVLARMPLVFPDDGGSRTEIRSILESNQEIKRVFHLIHSFVNKLLEDMDSEAAHHKSFSNKLDTLLNLYQSDNSDYQEIMTLEFFDIFRVNGKKMSHYANLANQMVRNISRIHMKGRMKGYNNSLLDPLDEVLNCNDPIVLLGFSVGKNMPPAYNDPQYAEEKKRLIFESRRKLVFILLATEVVGAREKKIDIGNQKIQDVFDQILTPPEQIETTEFRDEKGNFVALETKNTTIPKKLHTKIFEKKIDQRRKIKVKNTRGENDELCVIIESRDPKKAEEMGRKVLNRGNSPYQFDDIFGRTIAIDTLKEWAMGRIERKVTYYAVDYESTDSHEGSLIKKECVCNDYAGVFAIMDAILHENPRAKILKYKPSPLPGGRIQSSGGGGGVKIPYAKFYIDIDGQREEIMIFPSTKEKSGKKGVYIRSGLHYKKEKGIDDEEYWFRRLTTPGKRSHYSPINVMFPQGIYGGIIEGASRI